MSNFTDRDSCGSLKFSDQSSISAFLFFFSRFSCSTKSRAIELRALHRVRTPFEISMRDFNRRVLRDICTRCKILRVATVAVYCNLGDQSFALVCFRCSRSTNGAIEPCTSNYDIYERPLVFARLRTSNIK